MSGVFPIPKYCVNFRSPGGIAVAHTVLRFWVLLAVVACGADGVEAPTITTDGGLTCPAGEVSCDATGQQIKICNQDDSTFTLVPCATLEFCRDGACLPRVCTPNAMECVRRRTQLCNANGSGFVGNSGTNCEAANMWCRAGECVRALCEPVCSASEYCSSEGTCVARVCEPNQRSCSTDNEAQLCDAIGSGFVETVDCTANSQVCHEGNCVAGGCGNGVVEAGEACDDGNSVATDGCTPDCNLAACGDGIQRTDLSEGEAGYEACDDGNQTQTDSCLNTCTAARCSDGIHRGDLAENAPGFEACDDGNEVQTDACLAGCVAARCGDAVVRLDRDEGDEGYEACDDGNRVDDDDCSNDCTFTCVDNGMLHFSGSRCVCNPCGFNQNNHYIELAALPSVSGAQSLTIEFYARLDAYSQYGALIRGVSGPGGQDVVVAITLRGDCGYGGARNTLIASWGGASMPSSQVVPLGQWQHYALTFDRGAVGFFINGVVQGTAQANNGATPAIFEHILYMFGLPFRGNENTNYQINGALRSVRISNTRRYLARFEPPETLVADADTIQLYSLDEMQGASLTDSVGNLRGVVRNNPAWQMYQACP
jgi:cysteine-rich repeat protein